MLVASGIRLVNKHNDSYFVSGESSWEHKSVAMQFAVELRRWSSALLLELTSLPTSIKVGLSSGPVVAGCIGI